MWPAVDGDKDVRPKPEMLNRIVFFDVEKDSPKRGDVNFRTNFALRDLQGSHVPTVECTARVIDDPVTVGVPQANWPADVSPDGKVRGVRTCTNGQYLDQRDGDTVFALEYNGSYTALSPLVDVFVKAKKETLLVELMEALHKNWSKTNGIVKAEPALAEIFATDLVSSLGALNRASEKVDGPRKLAAGLRALIEPDTTTDRKGQKKSLLDLLRGAIDAQDAVLSKDPKREKKWLDARSHIVDEFLTINGRGPDAKFADQGIPQLTPVVIELLRAQREAKCRNDKCAAFKADTVADVKKSLDSALTKTGLDLVDVMLQDEPTRVELGRMTSYLTRQSGPLASAGANSPSATPFATARGPGVLDATIAALVDALGALGDLRDIRPLYPMMANMMRELDPQLELLKRLNERVYDDAGHEICAEELDPDETIRNTLSRLAMVVDPAGLPRSTALQIFLDAIADVNRVDAASTDPLDGDDYGSVFRNVHDLLTDPESGLEQLYASVRSATAK
jgi:hypothetical protein